jgi:Golgi nucleoside diphosphatase
MRKYLNTVLVIIMSILSLTAFADGDHYAVFIDAGSTGSKLHVFRYNETASLPDIKDIFSEKIKPGLSSFADRPNEAGPYFKKLLDDASQFLQKSGADLKTTKINILATAGMRFLPEDKQKAIYSTLSNYVKNNYEFSMGNIKTISGQMEGFYGWLDVNYLLGRFQNDQSTVGSIDMGGASTQIAFATEDVSKPDDEIQIDVNHKHYMVFSKSFLGLGEDQIREKMMTDQAASNCFPTNYIFNKNGVGHFNVTSCDSIYTNIIQEQKVEQQMILTQDQSFIAYSGIYFTYNFLNTDKIPDQFSLESRIQNVCNKTWEELKKEYPNVPELYLSTDCANAVYDDQLIYNTYKIKGSQLTVTNQINQTEIDWTLGAVLYSLLEK